MKKLNSLSDLSVLKEVFNKVEPVVSTSNVLNKKTVRYYFDRYTNKLIKEEY